ncbi:alpha/beta fold hydrolase [Dyella subtropica]|uniref:alpha/beta fold hydrolase n=1 Tax=Dyella subtropica TaxID=2992127 RepID=UPI00224EA18A|nr:alpha/beta hydrolase [Dyella subtropica]
MESPSSNSSVNIDELATMFLTPKRVAARDDENAMLATGTPSEVMHADHPIHLWSWGTGPRVLLCHGWDSRGSHLGAFLQPLLAANLAVTLYDAPAHGDSPGHRSNVVDLGRALLTVADAVGPIAGLISHSAGSPASLWAFGKGLDVQASVHIAGPASLNNILRGYAYALGLPRDAMPAFKQRVESAIGCPVADLDAEALSHHLNHPALFIHDQDDREIPVSESQRLHQASPGSLLEVTAGLGHRRVVGDPGVVARAVQFLSERIVRAA